MSVFGRLAKEINLLLRAHGIKEDLVTSFNVRQFDASYHGQRSRNTCIKTLMDGSKLCIVIYRTHPDAATVHLMYDTITSHIGIVSSCDISNENNTLTSLDTHEANLKEFLEQYERDRRTKHKTKGRRGLMDI